MPRKSLRLPIHERNSSPQSPTWGDANPLRGRNFTELAMDFKQSHPEGSTLSQTEFDTWAATAGQYSIPVDADKKSDAWLAHLQRRHQLRYNLNKAATHPRMNVAGVGAYVIVALKGGLYKVESPHEHVAAQEMTKRVTSLVRHKRQQLNYLMQSADWTLLPTYERAIAEELYHDINGFKRVIDLQSELLTTKFERLAAKLKKAVESGEIRPNNGGIRQLIAPPPVIHDATLEPEVDVMDEDEYC